MKAENVTISFTNEKLGNKIPSVSIIPECSCRNDAPCTHLCYAQKGKFRCDNVTKSYWNNYNAYKSDKKGFFRALIKFLNNGMINYKFFRWHVGGDIVDADYFTGMLEVARKCKNTKFLCYTKKYELVNDYVAKGGHIPGNLTIIFSAWFKGWKVPNPYNFPMAYVRFKNPVLNPEMSESVHECPGYCEDCRCKCWKLKKGESVVFNQH